MKRRDLLTGAYISLTSISALGMAGCLHGGGSTDSDDDSDGDSDEQTLGEAGKVADNTVDGIDVVGAEAAAEGSEFVVTLTLENVGDQSTNLANYRVIVDFYDENGEYLQGTWNPGFPDEREADPGETITYEVGFEPSNGGADVVNRYEVVIECGPDSSGVYCK